MPVHFLLSTAPSAPSEQEDSANRADALRGDPPAYSDSIPHVSVRTNNTSWTATEIAAVEGLSQQLGHRQLGRAFNQEIIRQGEARQHYRSNGRGNEPHWLLDDSEDPDMLDRVEAGEVEEYGDGNGYEDDNDGELEGDEEGDDMPGLVRNDARVERSRPLESVDARLAALNASLGHNRVHSRPGNTSDASLPLLYPDSVTLNYERDRLTHVSAPHSAFHRQNQREMRPFGGSQRLRHSRIQQVIITTEMAQRGARSRRLNPEGLPYTDLGLLESLYQRTTRVRQRNLSETVREYDHVVELAMAGAVSDHMEVLRRVEDEENRDMWSDSGDRGHHTWVHSRHIVSGAEAELQSRCLGARFDLGVAIGIREWCILQSGDLIYWKAWVKAGRSVHGVLFNVADNKFEVLDDDGESERLTYSRLRWTAREIARELDG